MCRETFQLLQSLDFHNVETQLALQCAPLLSGLKSSNLLIIPSKDEKAVKEILSDTPITLFPLMELKLKTTLFLYKEEELKLALSNKKVKEFLSKLGYENHNLDYVLNFFQKRYEAYCTYGKEFPHEMGILLGYPIEDVCGFINNQGQNYLHSGYWKVYENPSDKIILFTRFKNAKKKVLELIFNGLTIREIIMKDSECELQKIVI